MSKIGAHIQVTEKPGPVVAGAANAPHVLGAGGNSAQQPEIAFVHPGDHIMRDMTDWELALGVVADDPESFKWQLRIMHGLWFVIGAMVGSVLAITLPVIVGYLTQ